MPETNQPANPTKPAIPFSPELIAQLRTVDILSFWNTARDPETTEL